MPIGPQPPPTAEKRKRVEQESGSDSDDSVGPLPPMPREDEAAAKKTRVLGPSLPTAPPTEHAIESSKANRHADESSDSDDFGPSLPTERHAQTTDQSPGANSSYARASSTTTAAAPSQRDEWMTLAPTSGDWSQRIDPTKLKSRKFNTGKSTTTSKSGADAWHETPEQKQARLQREVLGIKGDKSSRAQLDSAPESKNDAETVRRLKEYNAQRGPSLYDAHQKGKKSEEEDDPSARAFDREKDIGGGSQINTTQRREMMKKTSDFNSRFSSAKYL